jgi:hypothetical protein
MRRSHSSSCKYFDFLPPGTNASLLPSHGKLIYQIAYSCDRLSGGLKRAVFESAEVFLMPIAWVCSKRPRFHPTNL